MTIDFAPFIVGLVLLWFPRQWMRRGVAFLRRRRRSAESARITEPWNNREPGDPRVEFVAEFSKFRNYIDLFRAIAGSVMLWGGLGISAAVTVAPGAGRTATLQLLACRAGVLLIGLLIQAVRVEKNRVSFYPAIFYLAGLSLTLSDPRGAAFAFVLIWAINPALPNAQAFLSVYALLILLFGYFFHKGIDLSVTFAGGLTFLPMLLSLLARRQLVIFTRKATRARVRA